MICAHWRLWSPKWPLKSTIACIKVYIGRKDCFGKVFRPKAQIVCKFCCQPKLHLLKYIEFIDTVWRYPWLASYTPIIVQHVHTFIIVTHTSEWIWRMVYYNGMGLTRRRKRGNHVVASSIDRSEKLWASDSSSHSASIIPQSTSIVFVRLLLLCAVRWTFGIHK